jgi:hypothetical protein
VGPTQPPIQWIPGAVSPGIMRQEGEADDSHLSNAEVKNSRAITLLLLLL